MERSNFPHRNLDEDDEELLNGIWAGLETPDDRPGADSRDFDDVKRRIRRRVRRRWMSRATLAGSAAAIVAAVVLVVRQPGVLPEPDAFAQLQQMGVYEQCAGVLLGTFTQLEQENGTDTAPELLRHFVRSDLPIAKTQQIGHGEDSKAVMIGRSLLLSNEIL